MLRLSSHISNYFNPRPREEGDKGPQYISIGFGDFNPRPREEGDAFITDVEYVNNISIHALVKRATYYSGDGVFTMWISIHALVKRATKA